MFQRTRHILTLLATLATSQIVTVPNSTWSQIANINEIVCKVNDQDKTPDENNKVFYESLANLYYGTTVQIENDTSSELTFKVVWQLHQVPITSKVEWTPPIPANDSDEKKRHVAVSGADGNWYATTTVAIITDPGPPGVEVMLKCHSVLFIDIDEDEGLPSPPGPGQ